MKTLLVCILLFSGLSFNGNSTSKLLRHVNLDQGNGTMFVCSPCGNECDELETRDSGFCPYCHMPLVPKASLNFRTIAPSAVCAFIQAHPGVILLDVRTKEEFEGMADHFGTLKNALNIPVQQLESRLSSIGDLKNKEILVYCSHSHRSPQASYLLTQHGFRHVTNMSGGMSVMTDNACKN